MSQNAGPFVMGPVALGAPSTSVTAGYCALTGAPSTSVTAGYCALTFSPLACSVIDSITGSESKTICSVSTAVGSDFIDSTIVCNEPTNLQSVSSLPTAATSDYIDLPIVGGGSDCFNSPISVPGTYRLTDYMQCSYC